MTDSVAKFTGRAADYRRFRPGYPPSMVRLLARECGLGPDAAVADLGSGTGLSSKPFLDVGWRVYAVEPNADMRAAAEADLGAEPAFSSIDGTAEETGLASGCVDLVTAGQAFHWFDVDAVVRETHRLLRPPGWAALIWNCRSTEASPFMVGYQRLLDRYSLTGPAGVGHHDRRDGIERFFKDVKFRILSMDNYQLLDFDGLLGRLQSASYAPPPGHSDYEALSSGLSALFDAHHHNGTIRIEYQTRVYYGKLS